MNAVHTDLAPAAIGPYSQALVVPPGASLVFCSGQIPLDPATGVLVTGDIAVQARRVLDNLAAVLAAAGCSLADVAKTTIYLTDLADFATVNEVYGAAFGAHRPARATVGVSSLPKGARVEIDAVAVRS